MTESVSSNYSPIERIYMKCLTECVAYQTLKYVNHYDYGSTGKGCVTQTGKVFLVSGVWVVCSRCEGESPGKRVGSMTPTELAARRARCAWDPRSGWAVGQVEVERRACLGLGRIQCCNEELRGPGELGHLPEPLEVVSECRQTRNSLIWTARGLLASANGYLVPPIQGSSPGHAPLGIEHESTHDFHFGREGNANGWRLIWWLAEGKAVLSSHRHGKDKLVPGFQHGFITH